MKRFFLFPAACLLALPACTGVLDELHAENTLPFFDSAAIKRHVSDSFDRKTGLDINNRHLDEAKLIFNRSNWSFPITVPAGTYGDLNEFDLLYTRLGLIINHSEGQSYYAVDGPTLRAYDSQLLSFQLQMCFFDSENNLRYLQTTSAPATVDYYIVLSDEPFAGSADVITSNSEKKSFVFLDELFRTESENSFDIKDDTNKRNLRRSVYYYGSLELDGECPEAVRRDQDE